MTAYNSSATIGRALQSVANQNLQQEIEVVVVNDGSIDDTQRVIEKAFRENPRLHGRVYQNSQNEGTVFSRNRLLDLARGRYFAWLDSDDWWSKNKLSSQLSLLQTDPNLIGAVTSCRYLKGGIEVFYWRPESFSPLYVTAELLFYNWWAASSFLFDLRLLKGHDFRFELANQTAEDYQLYLFCMERGYIGCSRRGTTNVDVRFESESGQNKTTQQKLFIGQREQALARVFSAELATAPGYQEAFCGPRLEKEPALNLESMALWLDVLCKSRRLNSTFGKFYIIQLVGKYWIRFRHQTKDQPLSDLDGVGLTSLRSPKLKGLDVAYFWLGVFRAIVQRVVYHPQVRFFVAEPRVSRR